MLSIFQSDRACISTKFLEQKNHLLGWVVSLELFLGWQPKPGAETLLLRIVILIGTKNFCFYREKNLWNDWTILEHHSELRAGASIIIWKKNGLDTIRRNVMAVLFAKLEPLSRFIVSVKSLKASISKLLAMSSAVSSHEYKLQH